MVSQEGSQRLDKFRGDLSRVHLRLQDEEEFPNGRKFGQSLLQIEPLEFRCLQEDHEVVKMSVLNGL